MVYVSKHLFSAPDVKQQWIFKSPSAIILFYHPPENTRSSLKETLLYYILGLKTLHVEKKTHKTNDSCKMTKCRGEGEIKGANQNIKPTKYPSDYTTNINWLFTPRLGDFIYFHLWNSLQAMNLSEQRGWEGQGCPWQQRVSCFYIQGQRGTSDTTWIHDCDTGACTGKFCCPAEKKREAVIKKKKQACWNLDKGILKMGDKKWGWKQRPRPNNREIKVLLFREFTSMAGLTFFGQY